MTLLARQNTGSSPVPIIAIGLVVLAFVVVSAKYIAPILYYIAERMAGAPLQDVPVMWDFWWPIYLLVAVQVYTRARRSWLVFLALAAARILWGAIVLTLFFAKPQWDFWGLLWLFHEALAVISFAGGVALALTPSAREAMITRSRGISVPA